MTPACLSIHSNIGGTPVKRHEGVAIIRLDDWLTREQAVFSRRRRMIDDAQKHIRNWDFYYINWKWRFFHVCLHNVSGDDEDEDERYRVSEVSADVNLYIVIIGVGAESLGVNIHHGVTCDPVRYRA